LRLVVGAVVASSVTAVHSLKGASRMGGVSKLLNASSMPSTYFTVLRNGTLEAVGAHMHTSTRRSLAPAWLRHVATR
jgi:hypothetical protein